MAKLCVKCGKRIPFLEGKRHADGMYCNQCDIEAFVKQNAEEFMKQNGQDSTKPSTEKNW